MYYRLKPSYIMRGWQKLSWVLIRRPDNEVRSLTQEMFQVLLLCDGETDIREELLNHDMNLALRQCIKEGIVEALEDAQPLNRDQYYHYYDNRYVQSVFWSVTGRCNFQCRHCYMDAPDGVLGELSTKEALDLIDQMASCGVLHVDITGGEPLVRTDFWDLIDRILMHKMTIGKIYTNGWLLDGSVLDGFESRNIRPKISVSFDGVKWHDWMRGIQGAESATLRALRLCNERGFDTDVEMCIHRGNMDLLPETVSALLEAGVTELKTSNIAMTELWKKRSENNALTQEEYTEAMIRYIPWFYEAGRPIELNLSGVIRLHRDRPHDVSVKHYDGTENCLDCYLCSTTRWSCYITPEGRLLPCLPMTSSAAQYQFPKISDIGLRQGLNESIYMQFVNRRVRDLIAVNKECAACEYRFKCGGGCRAMALLEDEDNLMGCDRLMCMFWKKGYVERIQKAADEAAAKYPATKI